jgi:hypothetical protein
MKPSGSGLSNLKSSCNNSNSLLKKRMMLRVMICSMLVLSVLCSYAQNIFPSTGYAGLGTTTPQAPLDIQLTGDEVQAMILGRLAEGNGSGTGTYLGVRTGDWYAYPRPFWLEHAFYGNGNSAIGFYRGGSVITGDMSFCTNQGAERLWLQSNGNIGIGLRYPSTLLAVNGTITARRAFVKEDNWPDYVFQPSFSLMPLPEVKKYVMQFAHLPNVPGALTIEQHGLDIGAMQKILLKKIEEIALYLIESEKENTTLQQENDLLAKELDRLTVK